MMCPPDQLPTIPVHLLVAWLISTILGWVSCPAPSEPVIPFPTAPVMIVDIVDLF
jgi:hypothetical protein